MKVGLEIFLERHTQFFKGKRVGLVTNMTGVNRRLVSAVDLLYQHADLKLTALYGPEHGIRGDGREGEKITSSIDPYTNLPVHSLYGENRKPTAEMLEDIDVLFFDLQDIGSRYYTYIYTMAYVMEACGEQGLPFVVLDRPNPIGGIAVEGNLLKPECRSFVGMYPIPNRHGLTIGEMALLYKHQFGIDCDVTVIAMEGWKRDMYFDQTKLCWVSPSPNSTGMDMCLLYPSTCLVEGTNLSEGRGTTRPFEWIGAPFIDGYKLAQQFNSRSVSGIIARPVSFVPTYQKHEGQRCEGIQLHVVDHKQVNSMKVGLTLLETIAQLYPEQFAFTPIVREGNSFFDLLAGDREVKEHVLNGTTPFFLDACQQEIEQYKAQVKPYLLYS